MKILFVAALALLVCCSAPAGDQPGNERVATQTYLQYVPGDTIATAICVYAGDVMICRYLIDPAHAQEALLYIASVLRGDEIYQLREHMRQDLGCRWERKNSSATWGRLKTDLERRRDAETKPKKD